MSALSTPRIADSPEKCKCCVFPGIPPQTGKSLETAKGAKIWGEHVEFLPVYADKTCIFIAGSGIIRTMIVNVTGKCVRKEFVAVLVCLFLIGNSVHGTVLCFGSDGHIEFESAFHEQCKDNVHSQSTDHGRHSSEVEHEHDRHCHSGQCVDVPISLGLAKISQTPEQLNSALAALAADGIVAVEQSDCSEHLPVSNAFVATSYFSPLRSIVLLI